MASNKYPIESLRKWQDSIVEEAKKKLREEDKLMPVAFLLTEKMNIEDSLLKTAVALGEKDELVSLDSSSVKPSDTIVIILDLNLTTTAVLNVLKSTMSAEQAAFVTALEAQGYSFGIANPAEGIVKVLMKMQNIDIKDVVALAIQLVIRKTEAFAYVKVDETWFVKQEGDVENFAEELDKFRAAHGGSIEDHPNAKEAISSFLETDGYIRMLNVGFRRNRPKTGRIIGFDEPIEIVENGGSKLEGRFAHLFDKAKEAPKPPPPPGSN